MAGLDRRAQVDSYSTGVTKVDLRNIPADAANRMAIAALPEAGVFKFSRATRTRANTPVEIVATNDSASNVLSAAYPNNPHVPRISTRDATSRRARP